MASLPLDNYAVLRTTDLDQARSVIWEYMGEHPIELEDPSQGLDARIHGRPIDRFAASYMSFGAATRTEPGEIAFYVLQLAVSGTYTVRQGDQEVVLRPGGIVILSPDVHVTTRWSADCGVVAYQMRAPDVMGHLSRLLGRPAIEPLRFDLVMDVDGGPGHDLDTRLLRPLAVQLNQTHGRFDDPVEARHVENTLMTGLLRAQPNTYSQLLEEMLGWPRP